MDRRDFLKLSGGAITCLREGTATDMTVYDAAASSVVVPLSVPSAGRNAAPLSIVHL